MSVCVCVCVCMCVCVRACVRACMCAVEEGAVWCIQVHLNFQLITAQVELK